MGEEVGDFFLKRYQIFKKIFYEVLRLDYIITLTYYVPFFEINCQKLRLIPIVCMDL